MIPGRLIISDPAELSPVTHISGETVTTAERRRSINGYPVPN